MMISFSLLSLLALQSHLIHAVPVTRRQSTVFQSYAKLTKPVLSPYYLDFGESKPYSLSDAYDYIGMNAVTLGFLAAKTEKCELFPLSENFYKDDDIVKYIQKGGTVGISFGGNLEDESAGKQHVQQACPDESSLAQLIEGAMDKYHTNNIEFDIEDKDNLADKNAQTKLAKALAIVKQHRSDTHIIYTLGAGVNGMGSGQQDYLKALKSDGNLSPDVVLIMAMNLGSTGSTTATVDDITLSIWSAAGQVGTIFGMSHNDAMKKTGMLPAIGIDNTNDMLDAGDLGGAWHVTNYARMASLPFVSYWSLNRDFPGGDPKKQGSGSSSDPSQKKEYQFFRTFHKGLFEYQPVSRAEVDEKQA